MTQAPGIFRKPDSGWRVFFVLLVAACLTVTVWFREGDGGPLHMVRGAYGVVMSPVVTFGSRISAPLRSLMGSSDDSTISAEEAQALREQNEKLAVEAMRLEEYRQENARLTALLQMKEAYSLEGVGARIIGRTSDSYNQTVLIDRGSNDGLTPDMAVMSRNGLLGKVESVTGSQATVRLIYDPQGSVSVMIQSTRAEGILKGSADGLLYLEYIDASQKVSVGDVVITSGAGGVYPKGIIIGEVVSVNDPSDATYHTIVVRPISSSETYEEVLVLTNPQDEVTYSDPAQSTVTDESTTNSSDGSASSASDASEGEDEGFSTDMDSSSESEEESDGADGSEEETGDETGDETWEDTDEDVVDETDEWAEGEETEEEGEL